MKSIPSISRRLLTAAAVSVALATSQATFASNEQLEFVPDDTLFYLGTGKPVAVEDFFAMLPGFFNAETMEKMIPEFDDLEGREQVFKHIIDFAEDPAKFTKEWGLGDKLQFSVYSVGMIPVFRIAGDAKQFETVLDKFDAENERKFDKLTHKGVSVRISPLENEEEKPAAMVAPTAAEIQSAESDLATASEESDIASQALQEANDKLDAAKASNDASGIAEAANQIATIAGEVSNLSSKQSAAEKALAMLNQKAADAEKQNLAGSKSGAGMIIAADENDLIFTLSSNAYDPDMLDQLLGLKKPEDSLEASGKLKELRKEWGYGDEMAMFLDFKLLADAITGGDSRAAKQLQEMTASNENMASFFQPFSAEPCKSEVRQLAANWPMMVSGNRRFEVGDETINFDSHFAMLLENESLRDTLKLLRGVVPVSQSNSDAMLSFGLGLDVESAPQLIRQLTELIGSVNYECQPIQMLNKINETDVSSASLGAAMVLPQMNILSELPLDGTAVSLNDLLPIPTPPGVEIFAAVKDKSIVFFSGEKAKDFAGRLGGNGQEGFLFSSLNTEMIIKKINDVVEELPEELRREQKMEPVLGYLDTYPLGNLSYKIDFTDKGIEMESVSEIARPPK